MCYGTRNLGKASLRRATLHGLGSARFAQRGNVLITLDTIRIVSALVAARGTRPFVGGFNLRLTPG